MANLISANSNAQHLGHSGKFQVEQNIWNRIERGEKINNASLSEFILSLNVLPDPFTIQPNRPCSLFFLAVERGRAEIVRKLTECAASINILPEALEEKNGPCQLSALHIASIHGYTEIIQILLDAGASFEALSQDGFYPLYFAFQYDRKEAIQILLQHAKNQNILSEVLEARNGHSGFTVLHRTCSKGDSETVSFLLQAGASLLSHSGEDEIFPLYIAVCDKNQNALNVIMQYLEKFPKEIRSQILEGRNGAQEMTALHEACTGGNSKIISSLLQGGASLFSLCNRGFSSLYAAAYYGKKDAVETILEHAKAQGSLKEVLEMTNGTKIPLTAKEIAIQEGHQKISTMLRQAEYHAINPDMFPFPGTVLSFPELERNEELSSKGKLGGQTSFYFNV
jgi:ankyrin repeat protein